MSTLDDINVVISATDEASGVIEKVNASLGDLSGAGLERANKSLKTFRDEMGKAEKNIKSQKENVISNQKALQSASVTLREKQAAVKAVAREYKANTAELKNNGSALKLEAENISKTIAQNKEKISTLQNSNKSLKRNSEEYKKNAEQIKKVRSENTDLISKNKALTASIKENDSAIEKAAKKYKDAQAEVKEAAAEYKKQSAAVKESKKAVAEAEATYGKFAQKLPEVEAAQKKIDKAMNAEKWVNTGKSMKDVGGAIDDITKPLQFAAAGTLALGVASGKAAMDYETAFTGVRKTVDGTEEQFVALNKGLRNMSETTPVAAKDLANLAAVGGQLGVGIENIEKFTKVIADMNVATNLTGEEGAATLAQFMNVMGENIDNVDRVGSSIVDLGNHSATTERDIAEMAQRMGSFARSVGIGTPQVLGYAAALASMGVEAQAGGSAVGRTWASIQKAVSGGGEELEAFAKYAGVSAEEFKKQWNTDASGAFNGFIKGLSQSKDLTAALEEVGINNTLDVTAIQLLAKGYDLMTDCLNRSSRAYEENTALTNEANAAYNTTANKLKMAMNAVTNAGIEWGNVLLPEVQKGAEWIGKAGEALGNMSEGQKQATLTAGKFILVTGASTKAVASGAKTIGGLVEGIGKLKEVANAGGAAGKIASATLGLGKLGLAVGVVTGGIYLAKKAYEGFENRKLNFSKDLAADAAELLDMQKRYSELNKLQWEYRDLTSRSNSGQLKGEELEYAKNRVEEIKKILSEQFKINVDSGDIDNAIEKSKQLMRSQMIPKRSELISQVGSISDNDYKDLVATWENNSRTLDEYSNKMQANSNASEAIQKLCNDWQELTVEQQMSVDKQKEFSKALNDAAHAGGIPEDWIYGYNEFGKALLDLGANYKELSDKSEKLRESINRDDETIRNMKKSCEDLAQIGILEIENGETEKGLNDMALAIKKAGLSATEYAQKAALAKTGVDSLSTAWRQAAEGNGTALNNVVNEYINSMQKFGASAQDTTVGAALIQNGFADIGQAAAKGDEAVKGVLDSIKSIGQQQGLFDGLNTEQITAKINDIAHAIGLLPKNKELTIDGKVVWKSDTSEPDSYEPEAEGTANFELGEHPTEAPNISGDANFTLGNHPTEAPAIPGTTNYNGNFPKSAPTIEGTAVYHVKLMGGGVLANRIQGNAKGTQNFSGGLAMVNDEEGVSDNRELIIDGGRAFIPHGRNVILPLSRGAKVYTARQTKRIMTAMGIPHYAQGKDNSEAFTTAKDDWTHYTKTHAVTITQELEKWVELSEKFKDNQKDIEDIEEEIYSLTVKQNDERNKASEKWADKRIFNNDWEEYGDDIYSAYDRIKVRNMEMVSSGKMTWDDYAEYMESAGEKMYDSRRDQSEKWLEHEKKYNKLSEDDYGAGLQRMREYTLQMYEQGLIDKEKYRQADRELEEKYLDFVSDKNANEYSAWQNDADMWERMRDTYDDWSEYNDSKLDFIKRKIEKVEDFYKDGKISFDEYDIATKNYQMDYYNEQSRIYDEKLQEFSSRISKLREKYSDAEQKLQDSWTVSDRKENIEDLQSQIAMYRNATTHAGQEKLKSLESQLKDAQRQQQLYELQQSNNKVLTQMQSQYDYLEENKAAKLRELMKSTVDIAKLEANMSAQIAAAKNALNSDSLRQYNVLRDIYSAIKGLRMGATYTDSRTINNYQGTYNPKGVWSIVNGIAVGGMGSFVF